MVRIKPVLPDFLFAPEICTCKVKDIIRGGFFFLQFIRSMTPFNCCILFEGCWKLPVFLDANQYGVLHTTELILSYPPDFPNTSVLNMYLSVLIWHFHTGCSRIGPQMMEL